MQHVTDDTPTLTCDHFQTKTRLHNLMHTTSRDAARRGIQHQAFTDFTYPMALKKSDLYASLWASCDELRGGMDASQYKDYVLFIRPGSGRAVRPARAMATRCC